MIFNSDAIFGGGIIGAYVTRPNSIYKPAKLLRGYHMAVFI